MSDYITERWRAHMYLRGTLDPTDADKQRARDEWCAAQYKWLHALRAKLNTTCPPGTGPHYRPCARVLRAIDDAIHAVRVGELKILPDGWAKTYLSRLDRLGLRADA